MRMTVLSWDGRNGKIFETPKYNFRIIKDTGEFDIFLSILIIKTVTIGASYRPSAMIFVLFAVN